MYVYLFYLCLNVILLEKYFLIIFMRIVFFIFLRFKFIKELFNFFLFLEIYNSLCFFLYYILCNKVFFEKLNIGKSFRLKNMF